MNDANKSIPDDIRAAGWVVAIHNDYWQDGCQHTFWLFTMKTDGAGDGQYVKGEGRTDAEALDEVRNKLGLAVSKPARTDAYDPVDKIILDFIRDMATNYDCDGDAHKYSTKCRVCEAREILELLESRSGQSGMGTDD